MKWGHLVGKNAQFGQKKVHILKSPGYDQYRTLYLVENKKISSAWFHIKKLGTTQNRQVFPKIVKRTGVNHVRGGAEALTQNVDICLIDKKLKLRDLR
jgi:hypothetical protein